MFEVIIFMFILFLLVSVPFVRFVPFNIHKIIYYMPIDIYRYFKYKKYNECKYFGFIKVFNGYWGSGKSLSAVDEVISSVYKKYNGLPVWDKDLKCFVPQKITIITNLKLKNVPYIPFESEQQFIHYEAAPGEILIFIVDEIGNVWNSRAFREFNPDVFNTMVQSRKRKMCIIGTLPDLKDVDACVRRFTREVIICDKTWRIIKHAHYNTKELENCPNPALLTPTKIEYKFVTDKMYEQYDTNEMVDKLKKDMDEGKMLSYRELGNVDALGDARLANLNRKGRRRMRGMTFR